MQIKTILRNYTKRLWGMVRRAVRSRPAWLRAVSFHREKRLRSQIVGPMLSDLEQRILWQKVGPMLSDLEQRILWQKVGPMLSDLENRVLWEKLPPILSELEQGILWERLPPILEEMALDHEERLWEMMKDHTHLSGKFYPYESKSGFYSLPGSSSESSASSSGIPIPPKHLWEGYAETEKEYLDSGKLHVSTMMQILDGDGFQVEEGFRVLELGCAAARMLRWLADKASTAEMWGVDISAEHIIWCQQNMSPPFHFFTNTTEPHLPFSDESLDFIFAGSVFTHISELADFWLIELRRVLKQGGRLYITIHDNHSIELFINEFPDFFLSEKLMETDRETNILSSEFGMFSLAMFSDSDKRTPKGAMVFYDIDYITGKLEEMFDLKSVSQEAYGCQTAILLEKR